MLALLKPLPLFPCFGNCRHVWCITCAISCLAAAMSACDRTLSSDMGLGGSSLSLKAGGLGMVVVRPTLMSPNRWLWQKYGT